METSNYKNFVGQVIPGKEKGVQFIVISHIPEYADSIGKHDANQVSSGMFTQCKGFFRSVKMVRAIKQTNTGLFRKKQINEEGVYDLSKETNFEYNAYDDGLEKSLLIEFPKNFPYKRNSLVGLLGGKRILLGIVYKDLLTFELELSKIIGGDDLAYYSGDKTLSGYESMRASSLYFIHYFSVKSNWKERFRSNLEVDQVIEFSTADFNPINKEYKIRAWVKIILK